VRIFWSSGIVYWEIVRQKSILDVMSEAILGICGQIAAEKFINREKEEAVYYISGRALL